VYASARYRFCPSCQLQTGTAVTGFSPANFGKDRHFAPDQRNLAVHLMNWNWELPGYDCRVSLLKRIAGFWPYFLIAIALTGFFGLAAVKTHRHRQHRAPGTDPQS